MIKALLGGIASAEAKDNTAQELTKAAYRKLSMPLYRGEKHQCPVCNARIRKFKPIYKAFKQSLIRHGFAHSADLFETLNLESYYCPACGVSDRERLFALYLYQRFEHLPKNAIYNFIDFAPTRGLSTVLRRLKFLNYRTADLYRADVDDNVDITDLSIYIDNSIDIFICSHVLSCVTNDIKAMSELRRVLKPGGFGIVMVPLIIGKEDTSEDAAVTTPSERCKYYCASEAVRLYGISDFVRRLQNVGFRVTRLGVEYFGSELFRLAGIKQSSVLYIVD